MKNSMIAIFLVVLAGGGVAQESYSAKSLFFAEDDSVMSASTGAKASPVASTVKTETAKKQVSTVAAYKKPAVPQQIGASFFVRLKNNDGSSHDVLASRKFKTGERFQLGVKVKHPTYVYILNEAPDGKVTQIYPQPGVDNFINAMGTVFFPGKGTFEFDDQPGTEQLLVYLSSTQMVGNVTERVRVANPDIVSAFADASTKTRACAEVRTANAITSAGSEGVQIASVGSNYASKGIEFKNEEVPSCGDQKAQYQGYASKGIMFTDDAAPAVGGQVASYVVKKVGAKTDKSLYLKIQLVHE